MKKEIEIILESLEGFKNPKIELEQYVTPPNLASFVVTTAKLFEDLKIVVDLGCGTGILAIASAILGAFSIGIDIDLDAIKIAKANAKKLGIKVDFILCDVRDFKIKKSCTVIMNPPFGIKKRHADRSFLEKAFEIGEKIYSIQSAGSEIFVRKKADEKGFRVTHVWKLMIPLRKTYSFHERPFKEIPVEVLRIEKKSCFSGR
ncbi:MAG: METTL5 family protein [Archaeoglobaceae archaeon]|nr:METTL5 family protein [Archaeoglobaceae archaeon]MDW7989173.1 METTL5 family protein [Archaeoglobaceae archaeon]